MRTVKTEALLPPAPPTERALLEGLLRMLEQLSDQTPDVRLWREKLEDFMHISGGAPSRVSSVATNEVDKAAIKR